MSTGTPFELYSDLDLTADGASERQRRAHLLDAIRQLPAYADALGYPKVKPMTVRLAQDFVLRLPHNRALPKVAVDDEGDILMRWSGLTGRCALTFEGSVLHMTVNPGATSQHVEPTIYNGGHIPPGLLLHIPTRG
ncbi:hypothetical protein MKK88_01865 [Methylobacterium sp. E-005]|uniref:hypothetical protein n=1 Tax=Methylobacterium sp. E-005 TaxID=2836549 RepID=UPI001FBA27D9|nr:hypothetical protein [Methylobacterium sp. E-005]MCJ2084741.1 hypothetical protein [Methylobacterium sp. E-005]